MKYYSAILRVISGLTIITILASFYFNNGNRISEGFNHISLYGQKVVLTGPQVYGGLIFISFIGFIWTIYGVITFFRTHRSHK
jgi:hypothetical protein